MNLHLGKNLAISALSLSGAVLVFFGVFLGESFSASAAPATVPPKDLRYFAVTENQTPLKATLARLQEIARQANLQMASDRLLTDDDFERSVLVSLRRLNPEYEGKILSHPAGYSVQKTMGSEVVALFFIGFKADEVSRILSKYDGVYAQNLKASSRAPASETVGGSGDGAVASGDASYARQILGSFKGCAKGVVQGFNAVTVDPFISAGKSLKGLSEIGWSRYWENSKRDFASAVDAVRNYERTIAKGVSSYRDLSPEEKSAFNCSIAGGGGAGSLAAKAAQKVATRGVAIEAAVTTEAVATESAGSQTIRQPRRSVDAEIAPARNAAPAREAVPAAPYAVERPGVEGMVVREWDSVPPSKDFISLTPEEFMKIHGEFDPSKVIKAPEPKRPVSQLPAGGDGKWYRSIIDLGSGHTGPVSYRILEKKPSGKVVIEFENPLQRGRVERREVKPGELLRGLKEIDPPAVRPQFKDGL